MKILISDYDGTFDTSESDIKLNCKKINEFIEDGNLFVLSSGRSKKSLNEKAMEHGIPYTFLGCCDGSFLFDKENTMHFAFTMPHDSIDVLSELTRQKKHLTLEYAYPEDYCEEYDKFKLLGSVALTIEDGKIDEEFTRTFEKIRASHPEYQYDVYGHKGLTFYLVRPHGVSKSSPIEYLREKYRVGKEDVFTIGDNANDIDLIKDYNGFRIGRDESLPHVELKEYGAVHELIDDIVQKKVLKRW